MERPAVNGKAAGSSPARGVPLRVARFGGRVQPLQYLRAEGFAVQRCSPIYANVLNSLRKLRKLQTWRGCYFCRRNIVTSLNPQVSNEE